MQGQVTEAEIIRRVAQRFGALAKSRSVEVGIGDDAAVLKLTRETETRHLVTTDTLIEGVHFDLNYMSLADVGYKALAVNLSDINAMGGESVAALGTLGVPRGATLEQIDDLLDGIEDALRLCSDAGQHCALVGGDTVAAPQWIVGFTVVGKLEGKPLLRSGAKPDDLLWHSEALGLSGIGLIQLQSSVGAHGCAPAEKKKMGAHPCAPTVHCRPIPPLALGPWLQRSGYATAAQDLSDSLSQVVLQLGAASGVGIELDFRGYEFAPEIAEFAKVNGDKSPAKLLLAQSEDYELLFTTPPEFADYLKDAPVACTRVGRVVDASKGNTYIDEHGSVHELKAVGFEHL